MKITTTKSRKLDLIEARRARIAIAGTRTYLATRTVVLSYSHHRAQTTVYRVMSGGNIVYSVLYPLPSW